MNKYLCPICDKHFKDNYNLTRHLNKKKQCLKKEIIETNPSKNIPKYSKIIQNIPKSVKNEGIIKDKEKTCSFCFTPLHI